VLIIDDLAQESSVDLWRDVTVVEPAVAVRRRLVDVVNVPQPRREEQGAPERVRDPVRCLTSLPLPLPSCKHDLPLNDRTSTLWSTHQESSPCVFNISIARGAPQMEKNGAVPKNRVLRWNHAKQRLPVKYFTKSTSREIASNMTLAEVICSPFSPFLGPVTQPEAAVGGLGVQGR
jgi:hypothetical protein